MAFAQPVGGAERIARLGNAQPECAAVEKGTFLAVFHEGRPVLKRYDVERGTLLATIPLPESGVENCQMTVATLDGQKTIALIRSEWTTQRVRLLVMNEDGRIRFRRALPHADRWPFHPQVAIRDRWVYYTHDGHVRTLDLSTGKDGPVFDFGRPREVHLWDDAEALFAVADGAAWGIDAAAGTKQPADTPVREKIYQDGLGEGPSRPLRLPSGNYVQLRIAVTLLDATGKVIAKQTSDGIIDNHVRFRTDGALFLAPDGVRVLANQPTTLYRVRIRDSAPADR